MLIQFPNNALTITNQQPILEQLAQHIEALIFATDVAITLEEIKTCLEETFETKFKKKDLEDALSELQNRYQQPDFSIEIVNISEGYQFLTKPAFHAGISTYLKQTTKKRLSKAALETMSIVAYKQPISKGDMERIRGVSCDYSIQKLLEKELVAIVGRSEGPGRPLLYGTSDKFMDYFGLKSLSDLPQPKDFKEPDTQIGEQAPIEEIVETPTRDANSTEED